MERQSVPAPIPAERPLTSATAEFLFRLITEIRPILEGRAEATTAGQLSPEVEGLFVKAFHEVSQKLPELKSAVMELRAAEFSLLDTIQGGDGDRIRGAGKRFTDTSDYLFSQLPLLEDRTKDGRTVSLKELPEPLKQENAVAQTRLDAGTTEAPGAPASQPRQGCGKQAAAQAEDLPWADDDWDDLTPQIRRLLRHMHGRNQDDVSNFAEVVWEKPYDNVSDQMIHTALSRANKFLAGQAHPRQLEKVRGEPVIRWV